MHKLTRDLVSSHLTVVSEEATLEQAKFAMDEKRIRHLAVFNDREQLTGIISQRDLANVRDPWASKVASYMSSPIEYVNQKESLRTVILRMLEKKISAVIIVDDNLKAVGIVTTDDILWCFADALKDSSESQTLFKFKDMQFVGDLAYKLSSIGI